MRNLNRNKSSIAFCNYKGVEDVVDAQGDYTSEKEVKYYPYVKIKAHVSGARGSSQVEVFGTDISYDKTVLLTKKEFIKSGINENSVFFIDVAPKYDNGTPAYDYRVRRIAETVNEVVIAIVKAENK